MLPIARINDPKTLRSEKFREWLFARNRRHAVAQNDQLLSFTESGWREEFRDDFLPKSRSEHIGTLSSSAATSKRHPRYATIPLVQALPTVDSYLFSLAASANTSMIYLASQGSVILVASLCKSDHPWGWLQD
jgi:hypothetical protein